MLNKAMISLTLLAFAGISVGQQSPGPAGRAKSPQALQAEIEALKPAKHVWRAIAWKTCPLEALKAAREQKKPLITWVFLGTPTDERC